MVAEYRIDRLGQLARQMQFTPQDTRLRQINAAEDLLHALDSNKAYPLEFVIFRITGYHPKSLSEELLAGEALQHDLGLLIERISDTLDVRADAFGEPVLSMEDVTQRFNVSAKTIQRWRRRGLPGRRFVFGDGKRRVGFPVSSVERFFAAHSDQMDRGTNLSLVSEAEREEILRRARRLAMECRCCEREIARRIAQKLNRSPITILHTIRHHDQQDPGAAILAHAAAPVSEKKRQRIVRAFRRGVSLKSLAKRAGLTRSAVYRVIVDERIDWLGRRKIKFIDDALYHQEDAEQVIGQIASQEPLIASGAPEDDRVPRDLPTYLQDLYRTPLLSAARERALFLKLNFHKFRFSVARRELEPQFARLRDLEELEHHWRAATETKNAILGANLRLVVSVARKHLRPGLSLMELISDGNMSLINAVEGFDVHRGCRFSTYATLALMKGFARSVPRMLARRPVVVMEGHDLECLPDRAGAPAGERLADREQVKLLLSQLSDRERSVLSGHYGLGRGPAATFEQLGKKMGLSKHRVRQIEQSAIAKLRRAAETIQN